MQTIKLTLVPQKANETWYFEYFEELKDINFLQLSQQAMCERANLFFLST